MFDTRQQQFVIGNYFYQKKTHLDLNYIQYLFDLIIEHDLDITSTDISLLLINSIPMKIKKNAQCFTEEPFVNLQFNIESEKKVYEALKYSIWLLISILALSDSQRNGCMALLVRKTFYFQIMEIMEINASRIFQY